MTGSRARRLGLGLLGAALAVGPVPGTAAPRAALAPEVDAASFPGPGPGVTRVYLRIPLPEAEPPRILVQLEIDPSDGPTLRHEWVLPEEGEAPAPDGAIRREFEAALPPGKVRLRVKAEAVESGRRGRVEREVVVPGFDPAFAISDPVFGHREEAAPEAAPEPAVFRPDPSRRLAGRERPAVLVALRDTLGPGAGPDYVVHYRIRDARGRDKGEGGLRTPRTGGAAQAVVPLVLDELASGTYSLEVTGALEGQEAAQERRFEVVAPPGPVRDPRELRTILGYVATNEEIRTLESTPDGDLSGFWERFWSRRDPDPSTPVNEAEVEFLTRVRYAVRMFGGMEPGWDTDRGRIYIQIGPPDRIEEMPVVGSSQRPTRIWYYYARDLTYVFQDVDGFGRFHLVRDRN